MLSRASQKLGDIAPRSSIHSKDSIYFVSIEIESSFISFIDDPVLLDPLLVVNNFNLLIANEIFINKVLKKELGLCKK